MKRGSVPTQVPFNNDKVFDLIVTLIQHINVKIQKLP